jgi:hypothetical protein
MLQFGAGAGKGLHQLPTTPLHTHRGYAGQNGAAGSPVENLNASQS